MTPAQKDTQTFTALVEITWDAELFPEDPDDMYEVADLEKVALYDALRAGLGSDTDIVIKKVAPVF
jgi:hypothetical protein